MAGYTQGSFFAITPTDDFDFNQFDEVKELNEKAEPSVLLGFTLDTTPSLMNWQTASRLQSVTRASC